MADLGKCRSCGAAIIWAKTKNGKAMPLDVEPVADGNTCLVDGVATVLSKTIAGIGREIGQPLYKSHFATCPSAAQHRKPR